MADQEDKMPVEQEDDAMDAEDQATTTNKTNKVLKFRNYYPRDEALRAHRLPPTPDIVSEIKKKFDEDSVNTNDDELLTLAPQKPNWDLKRDISKKVEKLDALTRRAITDLTRLKIQGQ